MDHKGNYKVLHNNTENHNNTGRGRLLLYRKHIKPKQVHVCMQTEFSECLCLQVKLEKKDKLIVVLVYRSESDGEEMANKINK